MQLANDLAKMKIHKHHKCMTLDIKDLFTNIPIAETLNITKHLLKYNRIPELTATQYIKLLHTILKQNYFTYDSKFYTCPRGVAMGSPIASTVAKIFLQNYEQAIVKHWMEDANISYYTRYVDDILIIFDTRLTTENDILTYMNNVHKNI